MKKFIDDTYGSGTEMPLSFAVVYFIVGVLVVVFMFNWSGIESISNGLPVLINKIILYYFGSFFFVTGLTFLALYFYCKPIPSTDHFKCLKILFAILSLIALSAVLFPYMLFILITEVIGKKMSINLLLENVDKIIKGLVCLFIWLFVWCFCLFLFTDIFSRLFVSITVISSSTIISYSTFLSIAISNGVTKKIYIKWIHVNSVEEQEAVSHQLDILWACMVLLLSFVAKPMDFSDSNVEIFVDAAFYSTATLTLLSKTIDLRNRSKKPAQPVERTQLSEPIALVEPVVQENCQIHNPPTPHKQKQIQKSRKKQKRRTKRK